MRLKHIKLAGFKSFVDATTVALPSNLVAVVGPNGCGKSNIIDAVRWVMGESSAKQLRGESMADVIFNGSSARLPVGKAAIELQFDNSDGSLGGQYAQYSEIAIRREVTRDGQSNYYLNNTRCRRRDITDIFLGTGLGPRSYAIIEQGMINRLIDAKPEELRVYIEEAAGISKYKERRRETELRIQHTRDNLLRLNDLRDELGRQLEQLQKQSESARKYQDYKQQEKLLQLQLHALRWQHLQQQLIGETQVLTQLETQLESLVAEQRAHEIQWLNIREQYSTANTHVDTVQADYYRLGAEIARLEQSVQHQQERRQQLIADQHEAVLALRQAELAQQRDQEVLEQVTKDLDILSPSLTQYLQQVEQLKAQVITAEQLARELQNQTDNVNQQNAQATQQASAEQARIQQLEQRLQQTEQQVQRLTSELQTIDSSLLQQAIQQLTAEQEHINNQLVQSQTTLTELNRQLLQQREHVSQTQQQQQTCRGELQQLQGKQSALLALQKTALGKTNKPTEAWLAQQQLTDALRLAQKIQVAPGWERAVEAILSDNLEAVCVDDLVTYSQALHDLKETDLTLIAKQASVNPNNIITNPHISAATLLSKVSFNEHELPITWLTGIYITETLAEALAMLPYLANHESVVTKAGEWLGSHWIKVLHAKDEHAGVLQRERDLIELNQKIEALQQQLATVQTTLQDSQTALQQIESQRDQQQQIVNRSTTELAQLTAQWQVKQGQLDQLQKRQQHINHDLTRLQTEHEQYQVSLTESRHLWQQALQQAEQQANARINLLQQRDTAYAELDSLRQQWREQENQTQQLKIQQQSLINQRDNSQQNLTRVQTELEKLTQRREQLAKNLQEVEEPIGGMQSNLENHLQQRLQVEQQLNTARQQLQVLDTQQRELETQRQSLEQRQTAVRDQLEQVRLQAQTLRVRGDDITQQVAETGEDINVICTQLPTDANLTEWETQLTRLLNRIERLGPINLMAISEYQTQSERKTYLDAQDTDLRTALDTLEQAIRTIDKETRVRFQETFDQVNVHFQQLFPQVFGGGRASLELTGDDLLDTGVSVMAQPPGKRNSTIHLLSGGEKALTAVALVFAIFQLNPAPFCMLDEVDAPLDDANVGRFCELVKQLSKQIQFIFITHNKLAMEMADQLTGVTMQEPGVSRLVAVDVDTALALAEA